MAALYDAIQSSFKTDVLIFFPFVMCLELQACVKSNCCSATRGMFKCLSPFLFFALCLASR